MITSRSNQKLKGIRRLRQRKGRQSSTDELLIEGPFLLEAAVQLGLDIDVTVATQECADRHRELMRRLPRPPVLAEAPLLDELADADAPRGVVAVVRRAERELRALSAPAARGTDCRGVVVYLDGIQDPSNLGAIARTAEATGVSILVTSPATVSWRHPRALRASTGSLLRLSVWSSVTSEDLETQLAPLPWYSLDAHGGDDLYSTSLPAASVLVLGAEAAGISPSVSERLTGSITIPLAPGVESLNVAVATGVVLFELVRRRRRDEGSFRSG